MRPSILNPLFAPVTSLKGVGPRIGALYKNLCGEYVIDVLWHLPSGVIDRRYSPKLKYADRDRVVTLKVRIAEHVPPRKRGLPYKIIAYDDTGQVAITYFNAKGDYLSNLYPTNRDLVISGMLERFRGGWSMSHPDYVLPAERASEIPALEPVYPLTNGLTSKLVRKAIQGILPRLPGLPEWHDPHLLKREQWPGWKDAVIFAHTPDACATPGDGRRGVWGEVGNSSANPPHPKSLSSHTPSPSGLRLWEERDFTPALRRLAYDELLADQLALAVIRRHHREAKGRAIQGTGALQKKLMATLPFALTEGQQKALEEIGADMSSTRRMLRLLQGDVGSGKTVVALLAMLQALEAGLQAALMAPTEILARQHAERLNGFLQPLGIQAHVLVGKSRASERRATLEGLANGSISLIVGTHALFSEDVKFKDLGLCVVDEQHRFGVQQRLQLSDKGRGVDILVMTATPIPRTLTLTAYGDMDVSRLTGKPAGRQPIDTRLIKMDRLQEVVEGVKRQLAKGAQVYWVCPLVEESEKLDLAAATERAEALQSAFQKSNLVAPPSTAAHGTQLVSLVHGRMSSDAKDKVMQDFVSGEIRVLVATTVIEVGVDVPNASLMIVEHAERFGLAQLHQLRGRVGRGAAKSTCLLIYQAPLGETAKARLKMLRETEDGFRIAEEDLRLRGPGELLGTRQSGWRDFRLADLSRDRDLLGMASKDAQAILANDPNLSTERGQALRTLLYLFQKDEAVKLFRSG